MPGESVVIEFTIKELLVDIKHDIGGLSHRVEELEKKTVTLDTIAQTQTRLKQLWLGYVAMIVGWALQFWYLVKHGS